MALLCTITVSVVRRGFSYERARFQATDWPDAAGRLEEWIALLTKENPDTILITMEKPN